MDRRNGKVTVHKIACAVDCGPAIYPDAIIAQMESAAIMALSVAFNEKIQFADGGVRTANFDEYQLLTMSAVPEIDVHISKSVHEMAASVNQAFRRLLRQWPMPFSMPPVCDYGSCPLNKSCLLRLSDKIPGSIECKMANIVLFFDYPLYKEMELNTLCCIVCRCSDAPAETYRTIGVKILVILTQLFLPQGGLHSAYITGHLSHLSWGMR